jgi:O-antigen/teichoic acid export membrane protein
MPTTSSKAITQSSLWLTSSFACVKAGQLLAQLVLARLLTPADFGVWGMVVLVNTLSDLFKDKTLASVLVQRGIEDRTVANAVYSLTISLSVVMFAVQVMVAYPLGIFFQQPLVHPLVTLTALGFLIGAGAGSHGAVLSRQMRFRELAIAEISGGMARLGVTLCAAFRGAGIWSFALGELAAVTVSSLLKRGFSHYPFTYQLFPDPAGVKAVRRYVQSILSINLAVYANTSGDNWMIGRLLGSQALGYYSLAYQLAMLPNYALSQINRVNFSVLSQRDPSGQQSYLKRLLRLYAWFAAPLYGMAFLLAPWLIPTLYGVAWTEAVPLFQIILGFAYSRGFMAILGTTLDALDKPHWNAVINWVLVPISLTAFYLGVQLNGTIGVAIAVTLILGVAATVWFWLAMGYAVGWPLMTLVKPILLPTLSVPVLILGVQILPLPSHLQEFLPPLILVVVYVSLFVFVGPYRRIGLEQAR